MQGETDPPAPSIAATSAEDEEIVRGLLSYDEPAVERFVARYRPLFHHCLAQFQADPIAREDLYQELLWHALARLRQGAFDRTKGSFGTWLYRVAWCRCVDLKRKENARRRLPVRLADEELLDEPDPAPGPESTVGVEEVGNLVREALAEIDAEERDLLLLRFVDCLSLVEVAERLRLSLEQTKYRLKRASAALRRSLATRLSRTEAVE